MLKWDPVFGPVRVKEEVESGDECIADDLAGRHDLSCGPVMRRQVGRCMIGQSAGTRAGQAFDCRPDYQGRSLLDVSFCKDEAFNEALLAELFAGLQAPGERTGWLMSCYEAMRARGLWPVNLPLEQLLADEEVFIQWGEIQPACPAAIQ